MNNEWSVVVLFVVAIFLLGGAQLNNHSGQGPLPLSTREKTLLLQLARRQLEAIASGREGIKVDPQTLPEALKRPAPCFVTLTKEGNLRGCMLDSFAAHEPIYANVLRNVILAAQHDPRFAPVSREEVASIRIEISILGTPKSLSFTSPDDLLQRLTPGKDGVILKTRWGLSTYLPQVWETFPDPAVFLSYLCEKQGAPADCWRGGSSIQVEIYRVSHFAEGAKND